MSEDNTKLNSVVDESGLSTRRKVLKTGAALIPTIITMHALPASASSKYENIAYRYGDNAGLCRNPKFNPHASGGPPSEKFIPCPDGGDDERGGGRKGNDNEY